MKMFQCKKKKHNHGYFGVNLLRKRAKSVYFAELDELSKLSCVER